MWVWQIPITHTVTSIGVVTQKKNFAKSKESREKFFWECIKSRPELYEGLKAQGSQQIKPFKDEGDYSYAMKQLAGDRVVLVSDAGCFVDPIFSTGVNIALNCSRFAHKDILGALETGNFSREAFKEYEAKLRLGTRNWYNFITVYYRLNVVILNIGLDIKIISPSLFSMMEIMALVTTFMTTPVLNLICPRELIEGASDKRTAERALASPVVGAARRNFHRLGHFVAPPSRRLPVLTKWPPSPLGVSASTSMRSSQSHLASALLSSARLAQPTSGPQPVRVDLPAGGERCARKLYDA